MNQNPSPKASGSTSKNSDSHPATKIIRRRAKGTLKSRLEDFMENASAEEVRFLDDVLMTRESEYGRSVAEVAIASAFEDSIKRRREYLHVPNDADGKTKETLKAFLAGRLKELPAEPTFPSRIRKGCSEEELAYCVRLIRLLRDNYWVAELVRQLLDKEALSRHKWTNKKVRNLLDNFDNIEALARNAQRLGNEWSNHPILRAIRREVGEHEIADYKGEYWVRDAIESAHPPGGK